MTTPNFLSNNQAYVQLRSRLAAAMEASLAASTPSTTTANVAAGLSASLALASAPAAAAAATTSSSAASALSTAAAAASSSSLTASELLGYLVSVGSGIVKLPQLVSLVRHRSTLGVSLSMYSVELFAQIVAVLYHQAKGFPFETYGENVTLGVGNWAILGCFAYLNQDPRAIVSLLFPLLLSPLKRYPSVLSTLQSLSIPLNIAAKLPQIIINQQLILVLGTHVRRTEQQVQRRKREEEKRRKQQQKEAQGQAGKEVPAAAANAALSPAPTAAVSQPVAPVSSSASSVPAPSPSPVPSPSSTSSSSSPSPLPSSVTSLSATPFALNFLGSFSRLYTTLRQLGGDRVMLLAFGVSCVLNAVVVLQCMHIKRLQRKQAQLVEMLTDRREEKGDKQM